MKKRTFAILTAICMGMSLLTACNGGEATAETKEPAAETTETAAKDEKTAEASGEKIIIGYSTCDMTVPFIIANNVGIYEACKDLNVELLIADSKNDVGTQLTDVQNLIAQGAQAIILTASDTNSAEAYHAITQEAGIPLIAMNRSIGDACEGFVGSDSREAAADLARYIIEEMGGSGNVVQLEGLLGDTTNNDRTNAILGVIEEYPDVERTRSEGCDWERVKAIEKVETWIQAGEEFGGVIANSDEMAVGAAIALEGANLLDDVIIGGIGGEAPALDAVKAGQMEITMSSSTFDMGYESVDMAVRYINGENDGFESINIPFSPVTSENIDEYLAEQERIDALGY